MDSLPVLIDGLMSDLPLPALTTDGSLFLFKKK
jgi:hypothetical protein